MLAREYIPENFRQLNMLRLFLPARGQYDGPQYWSTLLLEGEELTGSSDWNELCARSTQGRPTKEPPQAAMGGLDSPRAAALKEPLLPRLGAEAPFAIRSWSGYAETSGGPEHSDFDGREYLHGTLTLRYLLNRAQNDRIPDFGHALDGRFDWGSKLYPNSLNIAADPELSRAFFKYRRREVASIVEHRDVLPWRSGDCHAPRSTPAQVTIHGSHWPDDVIPSFAPTVEAAPSDHLPRPTQNQRPGRDREDFLRRTPPQGRHCVRRPAPLRGRQSGPRPAPRPH